MRRVVWTVVAGLLCPLLGLADERDDAELAALAIGVAPFERVAPPGEEAPDLAPRLAAEILARGVGRTVAPESLAGERAAEPSAGHVRSLAREQRLNALVVGRVTRLGERLSLDVRLRDGRSGSVVGTYVAELPIRDPPESVLAHLASQLVSGALAASEVSLAPPVPDESAAPVPARAPTRPTAAAAAPISLDKFDGSSPFSIRSDELEAIDQQGGGRKLVFRHGVEARQGDLVLRASRLEATYPQGEKQPSTLSARGEVSVEQGGRSARCQRADYRRSEQRIVCRGDAVLRDGHDEVRGDAIVFDLARRSVRIDGGTEVAIASSGGAGAKDAPSGDGDSPAKDTILGDLADGGPVTIRAQQLEATEQASGARRIRFSGSVEVAEEDLTLRARQIEALYPPGAKEPEKLVADGDVAVLQRGREAHCDHAVYLRAERRIECSGAASLRKGDDSVTGSTISFDLAQRTLVVSGGTRLVLAPREAGEPSRP